MNKDNNKLKSSFRDPSGFMFLDDDVLYRKVAPQYADTYRHLMESGLAEALFSANLLVPHVETEQNASGIILRPEKIPFISYPYEWSFPQLKDAALCTLRIAEIALNHGMILKDASAFNIQFHSGAPILLDTLSFELYEPGQPWTAYRQFCQHFLAPLALMSYRDHCLNLLLRVNLDGVPLDLASRLLPARTWLRPSILFHVHLHAASQRRYSSDKSRKQARTMFSENAMRGLISNLSNFVRSLRIRTHKTEWGDYYQQTNYSERASDQKAGIVEQILDAEKPQAVWDFGANDGRYSRLATGKNVPTVAWDIDPVAVARNYQMSRDGRDPYMVPLLLDLMNPSPDVGWHLAERDSLLQRGPADMGLALALIHHLAISNNVPLKRIAEFFSQASRKLLIEFVPKEDSQVQRLLTSRVDIFDNYTQTHFEEAFSRYFHLQKKFEVADSKRILYYMESR